MSIGISIRGERKFAKWEEFEISAGTPPADKGVEKNVNTGTDKGKVTGLDLHLHPLAGVNCQCWLGPMCAV